ncbi:hypothetical protein [Cupriavidus sp.]|uniref:hypothetical protein n=1 Tax=Cupriavidus sp. TaxID=1873897 RepID=UPI0025C5FB8A|nr:hypothetical protein [Cupriavidus sp.]MCA3185970.1 hypothetical protein [Cupriavidus sp.]MCA3193584.1 hypothetical protein [Cupriavidus sp.]MCA3199974.1 hypothetical protein [Cupriavidus sp.]MCA3201987.1 hypothetical protein [Cupriavidus sp.]MCA3233939.1 hypothetical protein [Cupriavidus sp.]
MSKSDWTPMRRLHAAGRLAVCDAKEVQGYWRGWMVWVQVDEETDDWYIRVTDPRGCYAYDGWWAESSNKTAADAVAEAFRGACLLDLVEERT